MDYLWDAGGAGMTEVIALDSPVKPENDDSLTLPPHPASGRPLPRHGGEGILGDHI